MTLDEIKKIADEIDNDTNIDLSGAYGSIIAVIKGAKQNSDVVPISKLIELIEKWTESISEAPEHAAIVAAHIQDLNRLLKGG